jgi:UDP-N-acetylmuramate--alanine ligase
MILRSGTLRGSRLYLIGIKGTGMSALAELLLSEGASVSGSDVEERFYTDEILEKNAIPVHQGFDPANVPAEADLVIYSPAYDPATHPELVRTRELGHRMLEYTAALGEYSASIPLAGVSGIHGKTTTTAMLGTLIRELDLPGKVLVGSAVSNFGGHPTFSNGDDFFVAETCEYRRHFLDFSPRHILVTSIEADHLDYFADEADVRAAFREYLDKLPAGGSAVYCADDPGASETLEAFAAARPDVKVIPYGFSADGQYSLEQLPPRDRAQCFRIGGFADEFVLPYPGRHSLRNAAGALALLGSILGMDAAELERAHGTALRRALASFSGTSRRSEIIADAGGIRIIDDYAHHPTAIRSTLAGFRELYPSARIAVDFMSHTYSRTSALLEEFAASFSDADLVILNDIYASARETNHSGISGLTLYEQTAARHSLVRYETDFDKAADFAYHWLRAGDLFITMGAGNNWRIGRILAGKLEGDASAPIAEGDQRI